MNRLNQTFPKKYYDLIDSPYVLSSDAEDEVISANAGIDSGSELRLDSLYGDEIWLKLVSLGLNEQSFKDKDLLEVCCGSGFLAFHLLNRITCKSLTLNDISPIELNSARELLNFAHSHQEASYLLGDMHLLNVSMKFDVVIGNSFLHHFYNVPMAIKTIHSMLNPGGIFISLHEPTRMSLVVEYGKFYLWPFAIFFPQFILETARKMHKGCRSNIDIWLFEPSELNSLAKKAGFIKLKQKPWGFFRPLVVRIFGINLSLAYTEPSRFHRLLLRGAIWFDSKLNKLLPSRCFGSTSLLFKR